VIARTVAEQMGTALGQTIVIENIGGAAARRRSPAPHAWPDGYTIAIGNAGTNAAAYTSIRCSFSPMRSRDRCRGEDIRIVARARIFPRYVRDSSPTPKAIRARSISVTPASALRISDLQEFVQAAGSM